MEDEKKKINWLQLAIGVGLGMILYKIIFEHLLPVIF